MTAIQQNQWEQINVFTWSELSPNVWEDFRLALYESMGEMASQGVSIEQSKSTFNMVINTSSKGIKIVQASIVDTQKSEMITSIIVSKRDYKSEMLKYLPLYERKSSVFNEIINAQDREFRNVEQQLEVVERNLFIDSAIESLPIYERDLGITSINTLSYDQRREQIASRNRAAFDQTTEETIKSVASAFSNGDVEVNATETAGLFEIKFVGTKGIPDNIDGLKEALDIIIPAHLGITYTFTFNAWGLVQHMTWNDATSYTWDEFRNEVF